MAQGFQAWNAAGQLIIDTSTYLPRSVYIGQVTAAGSVTILPIAQGINAGVPIIQDTSGLGANDAPPNVTLSGSTLSWSPRPGKTMSANLRVALL